MMTGWNTPPKKQLHHAAAAVTELRGHRLEETVDSGSLNGGGYRTLASEE